MREMRRIAMVLLCATPLSLGACASLLGYDDLSERAQGDAGVSLDAHANDATVDSDTQATSETTADAGPIDRLPPTRPPGAAVASGKGKKLWFEVKRFYLGSQDHTGTTNRDGWREWGYDLDHVCTNQKESRENTGTCRRVDGADQDDLIDGDGCRDNNFGAKIVPLVLLSNPSFEDTTNLGIIKGGGTWIFEIEDLDDGPNDPYAPGRLYRAAQVEGESPHLALDGTDVRTVTSDSVIDGDVEKPTVAFTLGYLRDNVWVSGDPSTFDVLVPLGDFSATMPLAAGVVTMLLSDDHTVASAGVAAGALPGARFEELLRPVAERAGFCPGSTLYNSFLKTVAKFPDVVAGAPNLQDTTRTCDSISIGVGLDFAPIVPVTQVVPAPTIPPGACGDAGTDRMSGLIRSSVPRPPIEAIVKRRTQPHTSLTRALVGDKHVHIQ